MKNLTKDYNREYYRKIFKIKIKLKWRLFKLSLISKLFKLCVKIDKEMSINLVHKLSDHYERIEYATED